MSSIPSNLARVPNLLRSSLLLGGITRANVGLLTVQNQLASGKTVSRFSDNPIAASAINVLRERQAVGEQTLSNLGAAQNTLNYLDTSIADATTLVREARNIASGQIGATSSAATRNTQAIVIEGAISQLLELSNRSTNGTYIFGGATSTSAPVVQTQNGYRYIGRGSGQYGLLGSASDIPFTIGGDNAIGEVSARIRSVKDLNPALTSGLKLSDLGGARSQGISAGQVSFSFGTGPTASADLSGADTVQDVVNALSSAIKKYETDNSVTILGPGGVSVRNGGISIDVVTGTPTNPQLSFTDVGQGLTGKDLGLTQSSFSATSAVGSDLNPKLTLLSPLSSIPGLTVPAGTIRFRFTSGSGSAVTEVNLSGATTVDQLRNLIETQVPGVRVAINQAGNAIDIVNEVGGPTLSIEPTGTGPDTATQLGIRSLSSQTLISDFNDARGVRIVDNKTDPVTGVATKALNSDFRVTLGNGQAFDVDLRPQDLKDVQSLLDRINSEFATAVGQPPVNASAPPLAAGQFTAALPTTGNGIAFTQTVTGAIKIDKQNNSAAAEDLGLLNGAYDPASATFVAQDRAGVRVNNLFSSLVRLRDALRSDDSAGITLAGDEIDQSISRLSATQALVGVYANRLTRATERQTDENTLHQKLQSELQDVDYAEASIRFNTLRTQLQAALQTGSNSQSLTLLDFLR